MAWHRLNLELLTCATHGHVPADPADTDERTGPKLVRRTGDGLRWRRCLRCDAWLPSQDPHAPDGATADSVTPDAATPSTVTPGIATPDHAADDDRRPPRAVAVPERGRALQDRYVLRLIALDRVLHFLLLGTAAVVVLLFTADRARLADPFYRVVDALQNGVGGVGARPGTGVAGELEKAFTASSAKLWLLGAALAAYALLEGVEAVGLWLARRWAEYLTFVATTVLLVPEVWELTGRVTFFKVTALVVNIAVVVYLIYAKRLFGLRGGVPALQRERDRDMSWEALERTFLHPAS